MDLRQTLIRLGIALALGLLVGLQRERAASQVAGVRTFPLITLFGAITALVAATLGSWVVAAGLLALAAMLVVANVLKMRQSDVDPGLTTEVAVLLMYGVGAYLINGHIGAAVVVGGAVVLLLHLKEPLHRVVRAMGERDLAAIMQFALITFVILPVLPDKGYGPYDILNPHRIWWMVVLIVAISLGGYVAYKLLGAKAGSLLGGALGGLISSTAATVSYARRTREGGTTGDEDKTGGKRVHAAAKLATLVIVIASTVSLVRVIIEVSAVAPGQFRALAGPLIGLLAWMAVLSAAAYFMGRGEEPGTLPEARNPAELKPALIFGALYAVVILAVAFANDKLGGAGLYAVAVISGLTDMDAITLSTASLAKGGRLDVNVARRVILLAALANLVFKGVSAVVLGSTELRWRIAVFFGLALAGGMAIFLLWP